MRITFFGHAAFAFDAARAHFEATLGDAVKLNTPPERVDDDDWDWTIDATFCANDAAGVDRYEPCLVVLLEGPTDKAVTVMDGPLPSLPSATAILQSSVPVA